MNVKPPAPTDVAIVGGGLVGASLAIALSREGVSTTLVESRTPALALADPNRERFLALARASVNALDALGVWAQLAAHASPISAVHVSRRGDFGRVLLKASDYGLDRFGAVVPASRLGQALEAALIGASAVTRIAPATVTNFDSDAGGVDLLVTGEQGERRIASSVLVGADGADSFVRAHAGIAVESDAYGQDALVRSVGLTRDHGGVAYERFTDDGAIALLPLPDRRAALVWTVPHARAEALQSAGETAWMDAVQASFGQRLGRFHSPGQCVRHPLSRTFASQTVRGRVVLVGNAAQSLHPIAAQGFNLGLRDALVLAEEIAAARPAALNQGAAAASVSDDGSDDANDVSTWPADRVALALNRYAARRSSDRQRIAQFSHALARWPKVNAPGSGILRQLAFAALNASPATRRSLVLAAMGYGDDVPDLALDPVA